ncbi:Tetrapyrrole biosynthesis, hydroxymethylbilane synthase [Syntrophomonas zehnderi OL-4]|uniref:Porphobilinogen deaminase n=1 Tax=Syntrophomonas zehnderi OL-4 TaxID=690567 RepID=A0A0E4GCA8_9FIRM|nr:hydroxymethylbilane synthase [Syntrophomonas zehnderi]CFX92577.1 Tetrapyrrole biosynthesis, hydroxymethylbilane synthase [Syntrophomonas zehnderi OL-4]
MQVLRLGTRGSKLAIWQAEYVARQISARMPELNIEIVIIKTKGDKILDVPLAQIGDKGLFTREIENELLANRIDLAVHSMKDLPSVLGEGLALGAVLKREIPQDVLISPQGYTLQTLPQGAVIGTSSLRRIAQLKALRPDLELVNMRGNVETRIRKMHEEQLDGIILAFAGVKRLGFVDSISQIIPVEQILPAVGQGAVAVEIRRDDVPVRSILESINDTECWLETSAERAFLAELEGGCQVPIACLARVTESKVLIEGLVAALDGSQVYKDSVEIELPLDYEFLTDFSVRQATVRQVKEAGQGLAASLLRAGAGQILEEIKGLGD